MTPGEKNKEYVRQRWMMTPSIEAQAKTINKGLDQTIELLEKQSETS